jgi:gas vesicle protein
MTRPSRGELVVVGFDYELLETRVAEKVRFIADRIREKVKKTLEDIIEIGNNLLDVKSALPHGQFGPWLQAEFGWGERMAQNFMSVAERFGVKSEIIADLTIEPTAAYLLAAPSVPDEVRKKAVERAESGERITATVAKEILTEAKRKRKLLRRKIALPDKLSERLAEVLADYRDRWDPKELKQLARQLRDFANTLDGPKSEKTPKRD